MPAVIEQFLGVHIALAPIIFIILRTVSILLAPFPGSSLDFVSIALFGKFWGFLYAEISIMAGAMIAFWIAREFGEPVVEKFIPVQRIHQWEDRILGKSKFWGLIFVRMITIPIFDYLSYVSGLTKITYKRFFITSILASIPPTALFYYLGGLFLEKEIYLALVAGFALWILSIFVPNMKFFRRLQPYFSIKGNIEKINNIIRNRK